MKSRFLGSGKWLFVGFFSGLIVTSLFFMAFLADIQEITEQSDNYKPSLTTRIYDRNGTLIDSLFTENRQYVEFTQIPPLLRNAFIASEDQNFYTHPGIDPRGIARALWQDIVNLRIVEGASTITMQLSRNRFLSHRRIWRRKIKETMLAFFLEKQYTKDEILEAYLNEIYFGHGAYGVKAAAQIYFGKELAELNLAEIAIMVGIPRSPSNFSPYNNFERAKQQQRRVLRRMYESGLISARDVEEALETPIVLSGLRERRSNNPYFVDHILRELLGHFDEKMVFSGGLKIHTTLDSEIQTIAVREFEKSGHQGGVLVMDPDTGGILAMVGGRDYRESKFNRTTQARRQPGSSFKPLIYAAAIDSGFSPSTVFIDEPVEFPDGWSPQNYEKTFSGAMTLREALERSTNIVGIKLLEAVSLDRAINYAKRLGIESHLEKNLSLALGTSEVTLLEMVRAFSAFANEGKIAEPIAILRVEDFEGNTIYENTPSTHRAVSADTAYVMARMLQGTIERGTGRRANINRPAGGKTGTTENFADAWFVGFTPDLVGGIFIGNDDGTPLGPAQTGGIIAAPIFASIMTEAHQDKPVRDFTKPDSIVEIRVCAETGLLPSPNCPQTIVMPFRPGTVPNATCREHP
ncbi:MAG TPA: penicillin-binding protein 1A [Atribacteraceae bacterium]|nr:penicillin-binding protein 1A [Atribacteraceae bacterium]